MIRFDTQDLTTVVFNRLPLKPLATLRDDKEQRWHYDA